MEHWPPLAEACSSLWPLLQSRLLLVQLWTIPTRSITGYQGEELSTSLSTSRPQEAVEDNEVASHSLFSKPDKPKALRLSSQNIPSSSFTSLVALLQAHLRTLTILLKSWGPDLCMELKVRLNQCWAQCTISSFVLSGDAVFDATRTGFVPLAGSHQAAAEQHPQIPLWFTAIALPLTLVPSVTGPGSSIPTC